MATAHDQCCGHDHVGKDELWLTVDEVVDLINDAVDAAVSLPADATRDERRMAMRARLDESRRQRAEAEARPPTRAERHDERARRIWGYDPA